MKKKYYDDLVIFFYSLITLVLFSFVNLNEAAGAFGISVPHINAKVVIIHFFFTVLSFFAFLSLRFIQRRSIYIDYVTAGLLVKCILDIIPLLIGNSDFSGYLGHYSISLSSFMCYFCVSNILIYDERKYTQLFILFGVILSLQVIYTFFAIPYSYTDLMYKSAMLIPYGGTNIITSILVPILCLVFLSQSVPAKKLTILLLILACVLTKSRGGMLLMVMCLSWLAFFILNGKYKAIKRILFVILLILFLVAIFSVDIVRLVSLGFATNNINLNSLSSGRIKIWIDNLRYFATGEHLFVGIGMLSSVSGLKESHNLIIDLFVKCGILGAINYFIMIYSLLKRGLSSKNYLSNPWFIMLCVILVNSMFEVCYFSYNSDILFWLIAGLMTVKSNQQGKVNQRYVTVSKMQVEG